MLRAAENGDAPLPQLHDAAGLAFGLLGLIVLLSLPATRAHPRRAAALARAGCRRPATRVRHQGGRPCTQRPPAIVATTPIAAISSGGQVTGSRSSTTRSAA